LAWHALAAPLATPRKARAYWEAMVWMAAHAPSPGRPGNLAEAELEDLVPETRGEACDLCAYLPVHGNVTTVEILTLARIVKALAPRRLFEFGTFNGGTTLQLAANAPADARILTLDLPRDSPLRGNEKIVDVSPTVAGERFLGTPWASKIELILANSQEFDFAPYRGTMDFVFVDASHDEEFVDGDSRAALSMLAPNGVALWHDYAAHAPGVVAVLDRLGAALPLRLVRQTSLVLYRAPAVENPAPSGKKA
jgi:predicted O-methyltransferase YrrM